jgi:hypothetical protein
MFYLYFFQFKDLGKIKLYFYMRKIFIIKKFKVNFMDKKNLSSSKRI